MSVILYFLSGFPYVWTWADEAFKPVNSYYSLMLDWIERCRAQPTLFRVASIVFFEILIFMIFSFYIYHLYYTYIPSFLCELLMPRIPENLPQPEWWTFVLIDVPVEQNF